MRTCVLGVEVLFFVEDVRGRLEFSKKNLSEQERETVTNSTTRTKHGSHLWNTNTRTTEPPYSKIVYTKKDTIFKIDLRGCNA